MENPYHEFDQINAELELGKIHEDYLARELSRLKTAEEEHRRLVSLIKLFVERNIIDDTITIKISKQHQVLGKTWNEILTMAFDERQKEFQSQQPAVVKAEAAEGNS